MEQSLWVWVNAISARLQWVMQQATQVLSVLPYLVNHSASDVPDTVHVPTHHGCKGTRCSNFWTPKVTDTRDSPCHSSKHAKVHLHVAHNLLKALIAFCETKRGYCCLLRSGLFCLLSALGMFPSAVVIQDDEGWFQGDEI